MEISDSCFHEWVFVQLMDDPNHPSPHEVRTGWKCRKCGTVAVTDGAFPLYGLVVLRGAT